MKKLLPILAVFCLTEPTFAQEKILYNVVYEFTYLRDLDNATAPYKCTMILSAGRSSSRYCTEKLFLDNDKKTIEARKREQERLERTSSAEMISVVGMPMLIVGKYGAFVNEEIIKNLGTKKMQVDARVGIRYFHTEADLPEIKWQLTDEVKNIGGYECQKATAKYGGRFYEAWFTSKIPSSDGPWKLTGLPGLILEARDTSGQINFTFKELSKNTDSDEKVQSFLYSDYSIKTNVQALAKATEAFVKDPEGVMSAQAPNSRLAIKNLDEPGDKSVLKVKKYNPMELLP